MLIKKCIKKIVVIFSCHFFGFLLKCVSVLQSRDTRQNKRCFGEDGPSRSVVLSTRDCQYRFYYTTRGLFARDYFKPIICLIFFFKSGIIINGRWRRNAGVDSLPPVSFQLAIGMRPKLPVVFHFTTKRPNTTIF